MGAVIERVVIRPVEGKSEINAVILTLGLFIVIQSGAALIWGSTYQSFPAPFGVRGVQVGGADLAITGFGIFTVLAVVVVMVLLTPLFRSTDLGFKMRAASFHSDALGRASCRERVCQYV